MIPPKIDLGICPLCKGSGFRKESDFTKIDCICEETGNKYFLYSPERNRTFTGKEYIKIDYVDKSLFDKVKLYMKDERIYYYGKPLTLYINSLNRLEPFYSTKDYNLSNYELPPLEDPIFPFHRTKPISL